MKLKYCKFCEKPNFEDILWKRVRIQDMKTPLLTCPLNPSSLISIVLKISVITIKYFPFCLRFTFLRLNFIPYTPPPHSIFNTSRVFSISAPKEDI